MRRPVVLGAIAATAAALFLPSGTANAAVDITITITAGNLTISDPNPATLTATLGNYSATLSPVVVTDNRGQLLPTWTASASMTNFVNQTHTVNASNTTYTTGLVLPTSGIGVALPALAPVSLTSAPQAVTTLALGLGIVGANKYQWTPTLSTPTNLYTVAGTYTASLTHSVA